MSINAETVFKASIKIIYGKSWNDLLDVCRRWFFITTQSFGRWILRGELRGHSRTVWALLRLPRCEQKWNDRRDRERTLAWNAYFLQPRWQGYSCWSWLACRNVYAWKFPSYLRRHQRQTCIRLDSIKTVNLFSILFFVHKIDFYQYIIITVIVRNKFIVILAESEVISIVRSGEIKACAADSVLAVIVDVACETVIIFAERIWKIFYVAKVLNVLLVELFQKRMVSLYEKSRDRLLLFLPSVFWFLEFTFPNHKNWIETVYLKTKLYWLSFEEFVKVIRV